MRSYLKIFMVVGLLALMMPLLLGYLAGPGVATMANTTGDHANSKTMTNETCMGCHSTTTWFNNGIYGNAHKRHLSSAFLNFATNSPSVDKGCGRCHQESVYGGNIYYSGQNYGGQGSSLEGDLSYTDSNVYSTTNSIPGGNAGEFRRAARKQVKADVCESCHGQFNTVPGSGPTGHNGVNLAQTSPNGCVVMPGGCHTSTGTGGDPVAKHVTVSYINQGYANSTVFCARCHGGLAWYQTTETSATLPKN